MFYLFFIVIIVPLLISSFIFINKRHLKIRDEVALAVFKKFDLKKEKEEIISKKYLLVDKKGICPKCGGILIERIGKYGEFIGCRSYPMCKFTKNEL